MKKIFNYLLMAIKALDSKLGLYIIVGLLLILLFVSQCVKTIQPDIGDINTKTDTVYVDKYLPGRVEYKYISLPYKYEVYRDREVTRVDSIMIKGDSIIVYNTDTIFQTLNSRFLTLYPNNDKLIQFELTSRSLELDLLTIEGKEIRKKYYINPVRNNYRYVNNQLSLQPKLVSNFDLNTEVLVRPFVQMYDLNLNLSLKTGKFTYMGGLNSYYYPTFENSIRVTPILGLRYTP